MGGMGGLSALMGGRPSSAQSDSTPPSRVQSSPGPRSGSGKWLTNKDMTLYRKLHIFWQIDKYQLLKNDTQSWWNVYVYLLQEQQVMCLPAQWPRPLSQHNNRQEAARAALGSLQLLPLLLQPPPRQEERLVIRVEGLETWAAALVYSSVTCRTYSPGWVRAQTVEGLKVGQGFIYSVYAVKSLIEHSSLLEDTPLIWDKFSQFVSISYIHCIP